MFFKKDGFADTFLSFYYRFFSHNLTSSYTHTQN